MQAEQVEVRSRVALIKYWAPSSILAKSFGALRRDVS